MTRESDQTAAYSPSARALHWLTAALVLVLIPVGIIMANIGPGTPQNFLYNLHRSIGVLLLPLVLARLIYRLGHPPPPLPADIPAAQQFAATLMHRALYALLIIQPIVGLIATSAYRAAISFFWLFELPPVWPQDRPFSERVFLGHRVIGFLLAILLCGHVGAALYHHFVRRDSVLRRMWW